jgi:hypothetical protein
MKKGKVKFINETNYLYRLHSDISQNDNRPKSREYFAKVIFNTMKRSYLHKRKGNPERIQQFSGNLQSFGISEFTFI